LPKKSICYYGFAAITGSNQLTSSVRVIDKRPTIHGGAISGKKMAQAALITLPNNWFENVVAAFAHPGLDPTHR